MPVITVSGACPTDATPIPIASESARMTPQTARNVPSPDDSAHRLRVRDVLRTTSSRSDDSSLHGTVTNIAAARPIRMNPRSANASWRNPAAVVMSIPGMSVRNTSAKPPDSARTSSSDFDATAMTAP